MSMPVRLDACPPHRCHRCGGPVELRVELPDPDWPGGAAKRVLILCRHCDQGRGSAAGLLAFLTYHPQINHDNLDEFTALLIDWLSRHGITVDAQTARAAVTARPPRGDLA